MRLLLPTALVLTWCLLPGCTTSGGHITGITLTSSPKETSRAPAADAGPDSDTVDWDALPRCEPRPACSTTPPNSPDAADSGPSSLSRRDVLVWTGRSMGSIIGCYQQHLRPQSADHEGRWVIRFVIVADGSVERAAVVDFRPVDARRQGQTNPQFEACITAIFCAIRFPAAAGRRSVRVSYPLHLDSAY